ncbi:hypothetical protein [Piscinibacter koreensis]|uniref:hypothetical protein n=1 Tax=Piscinibacter koreensis TaxID=2742824 RepID=UPI001C37CBD7|nr:hypothetical protein [Schlegelella koreensis]
MATRIDTVASRDKLKPRREPYWHRLGRGCYLGYRKMTVADALDAGWMAKKIERLENAIDRNRRWRSVQRKN